MTTESTTYDRKFNAQRGAQRAGLQPGKFEVFKTPDGRFGWRAVAEGEPAISRRKRARFRQRRISRSRRMRGFGRSSPSWWRLPRRAMSKASRPSTSIRFQRARRPWRAIAIWRSWPSGHAVWIDEAALR